MENPVLRGWVFLFGSPCYRLSTAQLGHSGKGGGYDPHRSVEMPMKRSEFSRSIFEHRLMGDNDEDFERLFSV